MKVEKGLSCLIAAVLAFALAIAGVGCIETAFGLGSLMNKPGVICCLAVCAVAFPAVLSLPHGGKWMLGLTVLAGLILLRSKEVMLQMESLLNKLSLVYDSGYGWGMIAWSDEVLATTPVTWGMILTGILVEFCVSWVVCRRRWPAVALTAGFLPLAACCVVTDTIPAEGYLYLLLSVQALLLLAHSNRRMRRADGIRLTAMLLVPVLILMIVLFGTVSPKNYESQSAKMQQTLSSWLEKLPFGSSGPDINVGVYGDGLEMDYVDLGSVGPRERLTYAVMDVVAHVTDTLYLRGQALDYYDGISWSVSAGQNSSDLFWPASGVKYQGEVEISTRAVHSLKYIPYYLEDGGSWQNNGILRCQNNTKKEDRYSFGLWLPDKYGSMVNMFNASLADAQAYLQLPADTRQAAQLLVQQILSTEQTMAEKAEAIRDYVSEQAEYDLDTPQMPEGEKDFALWFLQESDTGYCTHFASAATVLLRAAGIPARYVTGYTVNAMDNRRVTVMADQAHAWVEYLDEDMVWKVLEATPVDPNSSQPRPEITEPTVETTEPTQETTQPTEETTGPTQQTTQPTEDTADPTDDTAASTLPTKPTETLPAEPGEKPVDLSWLWPVVKVLLWVIGIAAAAWGQYVLRLHWRRKRLYTGKPNQQALRRWRYARWLGKLMRAGVPEKLSALADKAAFSQHTLTSSELMEYDLWVEERLQELRTWPFPLRICIRLIFAIG